MLDQKELDELTKHIRENLEKLLEMIAEPLPNEIKELINELNSTYSEIYEGIAKGKKESEIESQIITFGALGLRILSDISSWLPLSKNQSEKRNETEEHIIALLSSIHQKYPKNWKNLFESSPIDLNKVNERVKALSNEINIISNNNEQSVSDIESKIKNLRSELSDLSTRSEKIRDYIDNTISETNEIYNKGIENLQSKEERAQELLELISRDSISGSYQQSAAEEKKTADWLRALSLGFMVFMTIIMAVSLWDSVSPDFNWQSAMFRVAIVMILSIPAAYLAKESSKHRELQNSHHRVSLELKSVDPYLSSLPNDKRVLIKEKLAERIFMGGDAKETRRDQTPINTHEIVTSLIKKLDSEKS